jgi:hypothetical protein
VVENDEILESSTQAKKTPRARKGKELILSESELRRSLRIKKLHKGFKVSSCKEKNCLGYTSYPPEISTSIIRDLGATFCNINLDDLSEENLNKKPASKKPVGKKATKKKSGQPREDGDH